MFVDKAEVTIKAGDGGDGIVSFRHEKFVDRGGPDGGDGGDGGDVIFEASRNQNTLVNFRYQKLLKAENGKNGFKKKMHGRSGEDLIVPVPVGTVILGPEGETLADLVHDGDKAVIANGGKGGFGNAHFVSSRRQAPKVAEKGEQGDAVQAVLELKMIADVGLVGLPNAGKSTLLATVSNAHPEIANYPFTTLTPNLGVVDIDNKSSLLFADIPGLIEGASQGKGLGDEFLRHVERTSVLIHLIDSYSEDIVQAYKTIQAELHDYKVDLTDRPQVVVLTKIEGLDEEITKDQIKQLKKVVPKGTKIMAISAQSKQGVKELLFAVKDIITEQRANQPEPEEVIPVVTLKIDDAWTITQNNDVYVVTGRKIERFAARTDFGSEPAVRRLRDIMRKMGIMQALMRRGIEPGQKIKIGAVNGHSIEY